MQVIRGSRGFQLTQCASSTAIRLTPMCRSIGIGGIASRSATAASSARIRAEHLFGFVERSMSGAPFTPVAQRPHPIAHQGDHGKLLTVTPE
jgi:hypothetical protein